MAEEQQTFAIIAGGGTAGHVSPALAIAGALVDAGHPVASILYVGSSRGIEAQLVPAAGYRLELLGGRGIERKLTLANVRSVIALLKAVAVAVGLVRRTRPAVVVSVGGYASVPCALAAVVCRVPIVVAEQNAVPGLANRLVARFAKAVAVSFPGTPLPRAVVTGNPVRPAVAAVDRARDARPARTALGIEPGRRVVLVVGGSLGALRLNRAAVAAAGRWATRGDLTLRHVVGRRDWDAIAGEAPALPDGGLQYQLLPYEEHMAVALAAADVAVCRAGSSTCFELAAVGLPAVLVPSPFVTGDHQTANARHLVAAGGAVLVPDAELDGDRLVAEVEALLADPDRLTAMGLAIRSVGHPDAAARIAALADTHARPGRRRGPEGAP